MSQAGLVNVATVLPVTVATQYTTNSGLAIPSGNNLNVLGDDSTANNTNGVTTTGAGSTLSILITNRFYGTATSTNGSNADLVTFALGASTAVYRFEFKVTGRETTTGEGVGYNLYASFKTNGALATIIQTAFIDADEDIAGAALTMTTDGANNVILRATSSGTTTIIYAAVGSYVVV